MREQGDEDNAKESASDFKAIEPGQENYE